MCNKSSTGFNIMKEIRRIRPRVILQITFMGARFKERSLALIYQLYHLSDLDMQSIYNKQRFLEIFVHVQRQIIKSGVFYDYIQYNYIPSFHAIWWILSVMNK